MRLEVYKFDGLICVDVKIVYNKKEKILDNVVVDTGAVQTILNSNFVEDIGLFLDKNDVIGTTRGIGGEIKFFHKVIDELTIGQSSFSNIRIDFGNIDPKNEIKGLIGLDFLEITKSVIDVEIPLIYQKGMA